MLQESCKFHRRFFARDVRCRPGGAALHLDGRESELPHWLLLVVRPDTHCILWLDSADTYIHEEQPLALAERNERILIVKRALVEIDPRWAGAQPAAWDAWPLGVPQQTNNSDCGVYTMEFSRIIVCGQPHARAVRNGDIRRRIAEEVADAWCRERRGAPVLGGGEQWRCPWCTFVNGDHGAVCAMCEGMRS